MARPKASRRLTKKQKKATTQYLSSLKRSLERVDGRSFDFYTVKLTDHRLLKFLLSKAYIEKRYLPDMVEELIIRGLKYDKSYQDYTENDLAVEIQITPALRFYSQAWVATQKERKRGHSEATAS